MGRQIDKHAFQLAEVTGDPLPYWQRIVITDADCKQIPNGNGLNYISPEVCGALWINAGTFELPAGHGKPDQYHFHSHSNEEFAYILGGAGWIAVEDEIHHFEAGDFIFVPAHARHTWGVGEEAGLQVLFYRPIKPLPPDAKYPLDIRQFEKVSEGGSDKEEPSALQFEEITGEPNHYWTRVVITDDDCRQIPNANGLNYISPDVCGALWINAGTFGHPPGYGKPDEMHSHSNEEFNYILNGSGWIAVEDEVYHFKAGDFIFIPAHARHTWGNDGDEYLEILFYRPIKPLPPGVEFPLDIRRFKVIRDNS